MLSLMRKHASSWIIKFMLGAIIVVFIPWGVQRYTAGRSGRVAEVNGSIITLDDYRQTYSNLLDQVRQSFGNQLNEELIQTLQLRKRALDQLVDRILMLQAAEKFRIQVSDEEVAQSISNISAFQTAGVFDNQRYIYALSRSQLSPEIFETRQREALIIDKLQSFLTGNIKVSDVEARQWYRWNNSEMNIDYLLVEPQQFKNIKPTADEIQEYFKQHKESYKTDPEVKARYLYLNPENFAAKVTVSEDDIIDYYESNLEKFRSQKTVQARHILIKVDPNALPDKVDSARQRIEDVLELAKAGQDFAELARQYSEDQTKDIGGDLGTFGRQEMVKPFSDKAFSMEAGQISEPVRTDFGWHIIKVEQINPATTRSLDEARAEIQKDLQADRSKNMAYDEAEVIYDAIFEGQNLMDIAKERSLEIRTTEFFSQKKGPGGVKNAARFAAAAFELPLNEASDIQDLGDGYYLIEVIEKQAAQIPELKSVESKVKNDLIKEKQDAAALLEAQSILAELKKAESLVTVAGQFNLTPQSTGLFKRNASIPTVGYEPELTRAAFKLSETNKLHDDVIKGQKGYFVISFVERQEPSEEGFVKEKTQIKARLQQQKAFKAVGDWLTRLKDESEILIEEGFEAS